MGIKGIADAAKAAKKAAKATKVADAVTDVARVGDPLGGGGFREAARLRAAGEGGFTDEIVEQLDAGAIAEEAVIRETLTFDPKIEKIDFRRQTTSPEEYTRRYNEQLSDPDFASRAISQTNSNAAREEVSANMKADIEFQTKVKSKLYKNPRYQQQAELMTKDSAYGDRVFVNIARQTDTALGGTGDFVQFSRPYEQGLHSGSNNAAVEATVRSVKLHRKNLKLVDEEISSLALGTGVGNKEATRYFQNFLEEYFTVQFAEDGGRSAANTLVKYPAARELNEWLAERGLPTEGTQILSRFASINTASSTPHYFLGKNAFLFHDINGNFRPPEVRDQLIEAFPAQADKNAIAHAMNADQRGENVGLALGEFLESKGYDHGAYINAAEDHGTLSIVNWNKDLMLSLYDPRLTGGNATKMGAAAAAFYMSQFDSEGEDGA